MNSIHKTKISAAIWDRILTEYFSIERENDSQDQSDQAS
jgi:hypothetical protein